MGMTEPDTFGILLRRHRIDAGLTQEELAERARLSARAVSDLERGLRRAPYRGTVEQLADALGLTPEERSTFRRSARSNAVHTTAETGHEQSVGIRTFLIADIRGYTRFTVEQGDEAAARLAGHFAELCEAVVATHEGEVIELRGDEALAVFSSARNALRCALALQAVCARSLAADPSMPVRVGMGLDVGEAIPVKGGYRGTALNLAARLCSLAAAGEVLASDAVIHLARKIEGVLYRDRGQLQVKGFTDPVTVLEVVAEQASPDVATLPTGESETTEATQELPIGGFLGSLPSGALASRDTEMARILAAADAASQGAGRLLLLAGEAGVGKTRLAQEATLQLRNRSFLLGAGRCYEQEQTVPYYPFLDAMAMIFADAPPSVTRDAARRWPYLGALLPDQIDGLQPGGEQDDQQRVFRAVTGFLEAIAADRPIALLLDDLHWSDSASLKLLLHLARHTRTIPVLLLGTYRDMEVGRLHPLEAALRDLHREDLFERIDVRRLDQEGTSRLIAATLDQGAISSEFVELLYKRTEGNPFFVQQVLRVLVDRGDVFQKDGAWDRRTIEEIEVPESIRSVIGQRLSRLDTRSQEILQEASVFGSAFSFDELLAMSHRDERELEEALDEAARGGLLREIRKDTYSFDHALTQQALCAEMPTRRKRRLHLAAGEALQGLPERERAGRAAELARHFLEGDAPDRALPHAMEAGMKADAVFAHEEAELQYRRSVDLAQETGNTLLQAEALEKLSAVLEWRARHDEARMRYEDALRLIPESDRVGRARLYRKIALTWAKWRAQDQPDRALQSLHMAEQALGEEHPATRQAWRHEWMEIQLARAGVYYMVGRAPEIVGALERALPIAEESGTKQQQASLFDSLAVATLQRERYAATEEALSYAYRSYSLWQELEDLAKITETRFSLGFCLLWHGNLEEAETHLQGSLEEAARIQDTRVQTRCLTYLAVLNRKLGHLEEVRQYSIRSQEAARLADVPGYLAVAAANLAWVAFRQGDMATAQDHSRCALRGWDHIGALSAALYWLIGGPLLGIALVSRHIAEAVDHARALLAPTMQALPRPFVSALEAAVEAWEGERLETAVFHLERAGALGREEGYL